MTSSHETLAAHLLLSEMPGRAFSPPWFEEFADLIVSPGASSVEGGEESLFYPVYLS